MTTPLPQFYDLITSGGEALSPWCWHARMALAHKGITVERHERCFTQKQELIDKGGKSFPLLIDSDGSIHADSMDIILHLEESRPLPSLFPGGTATLAAYRFMHRYVQTILFPTVVSIILVDIPDTLEGDDKAYFIESREKRFGKSLAEVCADRDTALKTLSVQLDPFRKAMANGGYISGDAPAMPDYLLFGVLQWARVVSPVQLVEADDAIAAWMERMLDLFEGLGRTAAARG